MAEFGNLQRRNDELAQRRDCIAAAAVARAGLTDPYRGPYDLTSLPAIADECLEEVKARAPAGVNLARIGSGPHSDIGMALAHSTSDFPAIMQSIGARAALLGCDAADEAYPLYTRRGSMRDFKPARAVGIEAIPALPGVQELAEFTALKLADSGVIAQLGTVGAFWSVTRQAILNDDLNLLVNTAFAAGRAAMRSVGRGVVRSFATNPVMGDGVTLFHADHGNLLVGKVLNMDSVSEMRTALAKQTSNGERIGARLRYLIVPTNLEACAHAAVRGAWSSANPLQPPLQVIVEPRLDEYSDEAWYGTADPQA